MTETLRSMARVVEDFLVQQIEHAEAKHLPARAYDLIREVARLATDEMAEEVTRSYVAGLLWDLVHADCLDVSSSGRVSIVRPTAD